MEAIDLRNTACDDLGDHSDGIRHYYGAGAGRLAVDREGMPVALIYNAGQFWSKMPEMTDAEMQRAAGPQGRVVSGMASCWEFCVCD